MAKPSLTLRPGAFLGRTVRSSRVGPLFLVESAYGPGFKSPTHVHERAFCFLVLAGSCTQTRGPATRAAAASELVFLPAGETHADEWHAAGGRCLHVEFDARWLERIHAHSPVLDRPAEFRGGAPVWLAARLYRELRAPDDVSPLAAEGLALEFVAQAARDTPRAGGGAPAWVGRVRELLASRFREPVTLAEVAREAGVHPVSLAAGFRRHLRCTPGEFLRRLRVDFACRELRRTPAPLAEVALAAGFAHQSHLCRVFKDLTGTTPAAYRRLFQPGS
jgi:AraC family transcriptional regulator